ncbi:MAG: DnaJ domain-containing protein, partial [Myxococcota bacterium]
MTTDPYSVLGVSRGSSDDEIRTAYRKLARELHPDVNPGDKAAEERFKEVSAAYDILSDKEKRKLFDEFGHDGLKSGFDANQARQYQQWGGGFGGGGGFDPSAGYRVDFGGGRGGFDMGDLFGDFFGGGATAGRPRKGQDVVVRVKIELEQAVHGADIQVAVTGRSAPVRVRIPKGADTGSRLRVEGQGGPGAGGGPAGDLVIETEMREHP